MDFEVSPNFEDEQQFWNGEFADPTLQVSTVGVNILLLELENVVSKHCDTYDLIDDTLRSFLNLATTSRGG